ncbi:SWIM zinc finger family protein [Umezawaea endophytica]|uniref:SWIM zinc finger family protein n=2 Tax=Umezawaea endophytica TaxID=1654476 RepID=A0A9X3A3N8_9PSEU|nr:SWIM zinc finger family protein [Umezawaea endophytica]MCS7481934.1 SWIM zinc finger family protein [Umezawaea endophytica]
MRDDLLALTSDALAALANRGLLKRATKDLDAGAGPTVEVDGGTVRGRFPDGVEVELPVGVALGAAACSCGAQGVCRHRIAVVLAYQREGSGEAAPVFTAWSPGAIDDEALSGLLGVRGLAAARRSHAAGYPVRLRRPTAADPAASAELPSCTVRFLVPGELGYVHADATAARRDEFVAHAVWAFREADERGLVEDVVRFDVGGSAGPDRAGLAGVLELADRVLLDGAAHADPVLDAGLRRARVELGDRGLHWPAAAVDDLVGQLRAYRERSAHYRAERFAELVAELHARHRATGARSQVLGTDVPAETPLHRVRVTALGCRIRGTVEDRTAEVFFASGPTTLVLRHRWAIGEGESPTGHDLVSRRVAGTTLGALAASNIVSESASRSASRVLKVSAGRVSKTSITPVGRAWEGLSEPVLVRSLAAEAAALERLPPRLVRARVEAELVRVVAIGEVRSVGYSPGAQRLDAVVADEFGATARISATHRGEAPGALDALAGALESDPVMVSGSLRRVGGVVVIDPLAVLTGSGVVVLDLAPVRGVGVVPGYRESGSDLIGAAVDAALAVCADAAHRGLRHLAPGVRARLGEAAAGLRRVGLHGSAAAVTAFGEEVSARTWVDAQVRLLVAQECR